ncbi:MAG: patatin-like phospholipase family protein [Bacteroidales bacterium]|nr:patatin-like phospholipase family protein [Bacteroidales bacterium]
MKKLINLVFVMLLLVTACDKEESNNEIIITDENGVLVPEGKKIGLVLSGGGAKGAAEIGALKVIEQNNINIDYISGTSIGSIMGALFSAGYTADELEEFFSGLDKEEAKKSAVIRQTISDLLQAKNVTKFADLKIPFRCVAADTKTLEEVVISEGSVLDAVMASSAIPYIYDNVEINGRVLVDGGFYNNLPVDVVKNMGAEFTIVVDLRQNNESFVPAMYEPLIKMALKSPDLAKQFLGEATEIVTDYFDNRPDLAKYEANKESADCYIHPILTGYDAMSFGATDCKAMSEIGEKTAKAKLIVNR